MERQGIPQTLGRALINRLSSMPQLSEILRTTALSKIEVIATWVISQTSILSGIAHAYIGNVGIKMFISPDFRAYVDGSRDLDVIVKDIKTLEPLGVRKERLFSRWRREKMGMSFLYVPEYSPFAVYKLSIPSFQVGSTEYRELDVFCGEVGPISVHEDDFKRGKKVGYLSSASLTLLIASHINPLAYTYERGKRAFFAAISSENLDHEAIQLRLEESVEVVKREGISISSYKSGFERVSKKLKMIGNRYRKSKNIDEKGYVDNWERLCELIAKLAL
jgi:hypothetical protein